MVFIIGTNKYLPHSPDGYKLLTFIKYLKNDNKIVFCSGVSFFTLLYSLSLNFDLDLNILNITKDFQTVEDFENIPEKILAEINLKDRYIDYATGDLYQHTIKNSYWKPLENVGYHNRIIAAKYSKFLIKSYNKY